MLLIEICLQDDEFKPASYPDLTDCALMVQLNLADGIKMTIEQG